MNNLGVKYKTVEVLTGNTGENLNQLVLDKEVFHVTSKAQKEKAPGPPLSKEQGPAAASGEELQAAGRGPCAGTASKSQHYSNQPPGFSKWQK